VALALAAACTGVARAETVPFALGPAQPASSESPNAPGAVSLPFLLSAPPAVPEARSYDQLVDLWHRAGEAYGVPWEVLGAINKIESNFGQNMGPSSAGAVGWMQFLPSTWQSWGTDATGDGVADPWNPEDAVFSAARYLAAAGAREDLYGALYSYNHASWYPPDVLKLAAAISGGGISISAPTGGFGGGLVFRVDDIDQRLTDAEVAVSNAQRAVFETEIALERLGWRVSALTQAAGDPTLAPSKFRVLQHKAHGLDLRRQDLAVELGKRRHAAAAAQAQLEELRIEDSAVTFSRPSWNLAAGAELSGSFVFPVYGPASFSDDFGAARSNTGWHHGNDIFAPLGAPIVAVADGVLFKVGPSEIGGNRVWLRDAAGNEFYYAHLRDFAPQAVEGATVRAGDVIGYVGATGDAVGTSPHLHFEVHPSGLLGLGNDGVVDPYEYLSSWPRLGAESTPSFGTGAARTLAAASAPRPRVFTVVDEETVVSFTR
jgi:murein DD-endopeptidase MepM/ murein hydrolase activator NlpD